MTLEEFDNALAFRDLNTAYMDAEFREGIREVFRERDRLAGRVAYLTAANAALLRVESKQEEPNGIPDNF